MAEGGQVTDAEEEQGAVAHGPAHLHPRAVAMTLTVDPHLGGARADQFLSHKIKRLSRTRAAAIIDHGDLQRTDGVKLRPASRVVALETLTLWRVPPDEAPADVNIPVLHQDEQLVVFNKPPNIAVHPSARYYAGTLTQILRHTGFPKSAEADAVRVPRPAHRLDRETSGVLVCCRTESSERTWKKRFLRGRVEKTYLALCEGEPAWERAVLDAPLGVLPNLPVRIKMGPRPDGLPARTDVEVLWRGAGRSLLCCRPRTGRTHQIRAHLCAAGLPIVGDKLYGPQGVEWFARYADEGLSDELAAQLAHERQALHAAVLQAEDVAFLAPWPGDLRALCPDAAPAADAALESARVSLGIGPGVR
ncbi:MAG: RluA family pseudouridine synthase [Myxococcota bacterium]